MTRVFEEKELVLATHNENKIRELKGLLKKQVEQFHTSLELNLTEPEETGTTFEENAIIKAVATAKESGKPVLADDSGFCVVALNGDPGVYSARWGGPNRDFNMAREKVWSLVKDKSDLSAYFTTVIALAWPDGHVETVEGRVNGKVVWPPRGDEGFAYDPMFAPDEFEDGKTFGEVSLERKQSISHRAKAFSLMVEKCFPKQK